MKCLRYQKANVPNINKGIAWKLLEDSLLIWYPPMRELMWRRLRPVWEKAVRHKTPLRIFIFLVLASKAIPTHLGIGKFGKFAHVSQIPFNHYSHEDDRDHAATTTTATTSLMKATSAIIAIMCMYILQYIYTFILSSHQPKLTTSLL